MLLLLYQSWPETKETHKPNKLKYIILSREKKNNQNQLDTHLLAKEKQ